MPEFFDNQTITAAILNDTARDLGATEFSVFADGQTYNVDKLNEITSALTGAGVLQSKNKCAVTLSNNVICVDTGVIIFESGAKIVINTPVTLAFAENVANYIYAVFDSLNNKAYMLNSIEPISGDCVLLAKIYADRTIEVNMDKYSRSKTSVLGNNRVSDIFNCTIPTGSIPQGGLLWRNPYDTTGYSIAVIKWWSTNELCAVCVYNLNNGGSGICSAYNFQRSAVYSNGGNGGDSDNNEINFRSPSNKWVTARISNGVLEMISGLDNFFYAYEQNFTIQFF